jgi:hypothetical protein
MRGLRVLEVTMRDGNKFIGVVFTLLTRWVLEVTKRDGNLVPCSTKFLSFLALCFRSDYEGWNHDIV